MNELNIPILVINLKKDIYKKKRIERHLKSKKLNFNFFNAVDGGQLSDDEINSVYSKKNSLRQSKRELKSSEIGCAQSHLNIYKKIIKDGIEKIIILEDDVILSDDFIKSLSVINSLPNDWELILFGHSDTPDGITNNCSVKINLKNNFDFSASKPLATVGGAYGYMINISGAKKILDKAKILNQPIDNYTGDYKTINLYAIQPDTVRVDFSLGSSIQNDRQEAIDNLKSVSYQTRKKLKNNSSLYRKISKINKRRKGKRRWTLRCMARILFYKIKTFKIKNS